MATYKLKKGQKIGALAAESDLLLEKAFLDTGYVMDFINTDDPHFLILGRTGTGKTAIIRHIKQIVEHVSCIDPEELSMQYLYSNNILKFLLEQGIHFDIFFKFLWRHIFVLELIRMRYDNSDKKKNIIDTVRSVLLNDRKKETQKRALEYIEQHGTEYWILADTHIKALTTELESKLQEDEKIGASFKTSLIKMEDTSGSKSSKGAKEKLEMEIFERTQKIVNDYQISALNELVKKLSEHCFNDPQKKYYLVIDDLDKNWMPDDKLYIELIKSLLETVKELNSKLKGVKILVALRTNIYYRVFRKTKQTESQREKWKDVLHNITWSETELVSLIDKRLSEIFVGQYTKQPPTLLDVLPNPKKKHREKAIEYILDRTFLRPRDLIDFINTCIETSEYTLNFSWSDIESAELKYSKARLESLIDEWKDSYFGLPVLFAFLKKYPKFFLKDITESDIVDILTHKNVYKCEWLSNLYYNYSEGKYTAEQVKEELVKAMYVIGLIGYKDPSNNQLHFSFKEPFISLDLPVENYDSVSFVLHKTFYKSINPLEQI